ncbi:hypothetical protein Franean1_3064 [Parafrankia sp. EAN1pec]|nr:hypothetical protein Franean1_3064 [Frankia sp. EAN1pec]
MSPTSLPRRTGQGRPDRVDQSPVGIGGHQPHPGQATGDQAPEERQPAGTVLAGHDVEAEDLPVPVTVDPDREQAVHVDHTAVLTDLHRQRVRLDEPVRTGVQRPGPERLDLGVEVLRQLGHLRFRDVRDPELLDELVDPPGRYPEQIGRRHDRDQRLLGATTPSQQPFREVRALTQLRHRQLDRPSPGVPFPHPVAIPTVNPIRGYLPILGAADPVRLGAHQRLRERLHHRSQQVRTRCHQFLAERVSIGHSRAHGHRVSPCRVLRCSRKGSRGGRSTSRTATPASR